jgi:hypothetical protein
MKRFLIFTGIAVVIIILLGGVVLFFMRKQTKSFSPEEKISFSQNGVDINVFYNRPFKKGRKIFGGLVPYEKVWRTGANEATTFETNKALNFDGKVLQPGKYSLWTIPKENTWTIIFNSQYGQWGINFEGEANRDPSKDILQVEATAVQQDREFEQFTISFEKSGEDAEMVLIWDKTLVAVPFSY